jgi:hypothetical protein
MAKLRCLLLYLLLAAVLTGSPVFADGDAIDVLVVTGGKSFERDRFFAMFDSFAGINWREAAYPQAAEILFTDKVDAYDVLVFYDMYQQITPERQAAFLKLLRAGKPCLFLHHALVSFQGWDEYALIVGGRYYDEKRWRGPLPRRGYSTFRHDVDIPVRIVDAAHPVTAGIQDFMIHDEVYGKFDVVSEVTPLLMTDHPENEPVVAWTHVYAASQIVYIQFGHDTPVYENPDYRRLLHNAIRWLSTVQKKELMNG